MNSKMKKSGISIILIMLFLMNALPALSQTTTIDVLFAYTKEAADEAGGVAALKTIYIDNGVKLLNEALTNSQTNVQVRAIPMLVELSGVPSPKTATEVTQLLAEFSKSDGEYAQVHKYRREQKADILALIFNGSQGAGKANLAQSPADSNQSRAMMVTHLGTFDLTYVFPHEFAHILGCNHQNEKGISAYSSGFNSGDGVWRTIEANGGVSIPYFSSPRTVTTSISRRVNGSLSATNETIKIGDATTADCSRSIKEIGPAFSKFGDNLPVVTAAGKYAATLIDSAKAAKATIPFDQSYSGATAKAGIIFLSTAGKTYTVTVDGATATAPVNVIVKDAAGKELLKVSAFPGETKTGTFVAAASELYSLSTNNTYKSAAYRIQIK